MMKNTLWVMSLAVLLTVGAGCPASTPAPDIKDVSVTDTADTADGTAPDTAGEPVGCCAISGVCPLGELCISGVCHVTPGSGCYYDGECSPGQTCNDSELCTTCGPDSTCEAKVGACKYGAGCCNSNGDCGGGERCVEGTCRPKPPAEGTCWDDSHCTGELVCEGGESCPCGVSGCTAEPGYCGTAGVCCSGDQECDGAVCVAGACHQAPTAGSCFADTDCDSGKVCAGAALCPCGSEESCKVLTTAGTCLDAADVVCQAHSDCDDGWVCLGGVACGPNLGPNECYLDSHCGLSAICDGGSVCPDGDTTCETPTSKGLCLTLPQVCDNESDCGPGLRCVVPDIFVCPDTDAPTEGICVPEKDEGCWSNNDCPFNLRCASEEICVDPAGCADSHYAGFCDTFPQEGDCCVSHADCASDHECRNNNTTATCPPNATAVCVPKPTLGEECYNYFDCPAGLVCNNAFICACNARCWRSRMGDCALPSEQYCNADTDCGTDSTCARDWECLSNPCYNTNDCALGGKCQADAVGQCWAHHQCESGQFCKGLKVCPSNTTCPQNDEAGSCAPKDDVGACCDSYYACAPGTRCVSAASNTECKLDVSSTCVPLTVFNQTCFTDEDCAESRKCDGQTVCACGQQDCTPAEGTCVLKGIGE